MINTTLDDLVKSVQSLGLIISLELPAQQQFLLARAVARINRELTAFDKARGLLTDKYGKTQEDGSIIVPPDTEEYESFSKEFEDLLATGIELNMKRLPQGVLSGANLKASDLMTILWLFEDPESAVSDVAGGKKKSKPRKK